MSAPRRLPIVATAFEEAADGERLGRLRRRLAARAAAEDLLDVAYRTIDSPVGELLLAATPTGLVRVAFASEGRDRVLAELAARVSPRLLEAPFQLEAITRQLEEYFARRRRAFDVPLDLRLAHGFRREVLRLLPGIRYGSTASYTEVASAVGSPRAVRAVGSACATNPVPIVLPCHRVVRNDGSLGGYGGGISVKRRLLALESGSTAEP